MSGPARISCVQLLVRQNKFETHRTSALAKTTFLGKTSRSFALLFNLRLSFVSQIYFDT